MKPRERIAPTINQARRIARRTTIDEPITRERVEHSLMLVALLVANGHEKLAPLLDRLEHAADEFKRGGDAVSRARQILLDHSSHHE